MFLFLAVSLCGSQGAGFTGLSFMRDRMVFRPLADGLEHQLHLDDQQDGVDRHEAGNREEHGGGAQVRDGHSCRQHPFDDPGLASQLGHEPAALDGDPGQAS